MRFIGKKQVSELISLSRATIDRMEKEGAFPKRFAIGFRKLWIEDEILEWMKVRASQR